MKNLTEKKTSPYKIWSKSKNFARVYFGENYVQISIKRENGSSGFSNYSFDAKAYYKLVGVEEKLFTEHLSSIRYELEQKLKGKKSEIDLTFIKSKF